MGGVIGGITGALTKVPTPASPKVAREEVYGEFLDTYANISVTGGNTVKATDKLALKGLEETKAAFAATWDEAATVTASRTGVPLLNQYNSVESLLANATNLSRVKAGVQGFIKGDGKSIFKAITNNAQLQPNGQYLLKNGTIVGQHSSRYTGEFTIHINQANKIYKIRINP